MTGEVCRELEVVTDEVLTAEAGTDVAEDAMVNSQLVWTWLGFMYLAGEDLEVFEGIIEAGGCTSKLVEAATGGTAWLSGPGIATFQTDGARFADAEGNRRSKDYDRHQLAVVECMSSLQKRAGVGCRAGAGRPSRSGAQKRRWCTTFERELSDQSVMYVVGVLLAPLASSQLHRPYQEGNADDAQGQLRKCGVLRERGGVLA